MESFQLLVQSEAQTVVAKYERTAPLPGGYQSEADLERAFIQLLREMGYEYIHIATEEELIKNLRRQLEKLNNYAFSDNEWKRFFREVLCKQDLSIEARTELIQEAYIQSLQLDNGETKNIRLIDKRNIHKNTLQVVNQYAVNEKTVGKNAPKYSNRYDVTILVNGLPLVHIELKRRGILLQEAFNQIERYQRDSFWAGCGLYQFIQIFVISNGAQTKYYSNTTRFRHVNRGERARGGSKTSDSFEFTSYWSDATNRIIPDLMDFTRTFFARHTLLNVLTRYCVFTTDKRLLVMRPYQIAATEQIISRIRTASHYKKYGTTEGGGYIWHTTGSGKTLTSFKTAQLATQLEEIEKVIFVVDRKDLDYQTMKEYDKFQKGAANGNASTAELKRQLEDDDARIIITTIQKLSTFVKKNPYHEAFKKHLVLIFDECHRSQFGQMHRDITKSFKKYHLFGFTGTPIFAVNASAGRVASWRTTEQIFGSKLHTYTIVNAISDKNVLPFRVDYINTFKSKGTVQDKLVAGIDKEKVELNPERIQQVTKYILDHFHQKTYRQKSYSFNVLTNVQQVAQTHGKRDVQEQRARRYLSGFNSILAVSSVKAAKLYYEALKEQMEASGQKLTIAMIYSYGANDAVDDEENGSLGEENSENTVGLSASDREALDRAIEDYNNTFQTSYDTSSDKFQNYYKDLSLRMKNREIDLLIVVNMFLTGFDATTLNTLWVDKNLKMHGLLQAFSRTNRILNSTKAFGNIVCFRDLQDNVNETMGLFGDEKAGSVALLRGYQDYYKGYTDENQKHHPGYVELVRRLLLEFPLSEERIVGEKRQREFIHLFGAFLRMHHLLKTFDEFQEYALISEREFQDYLSRYQDLRNEWIMMQRQSRDKESILDDIVFEIELIRQIDINIDYILMLVKKYHDTNCNDKECLITIRKAMSASPELRSKRDLVENFIQSLNSSMVDIFEEWQAYVAQEKERQLVDIIRRERLNASETRKFMKHAFEVGSVKTTGTAIDKLLPPMSRFGDNNRSETKQRVIEALLNFFERFYGIA